MRYYIAIISLLIASIFAISLFYMTRSAAPLPLDDEQQQLEQQITLKVSHVVAQNTPKGLAAQHFADLVEQKSNGQITVQVFANAILYNDDNELEALQENDVQMIMPTVSKMTKHIPAWSLVDLPYLFSSTQDVERYFLSDDAKQLMAESSKQHIYTAAFWFNGFKQLLSEEPLQSIEDIAGHTARIMDSRYLAQQFELLHATPVSLAFQEVFMNAKEHAYTIQENTFSNIASKSFHDYQPYVTISNHGILSYAVLFNEDFYNSLPADARLIIDEALTETTLWHFEQSKTLNSLALQQLEQQAHVSTLSPSEKKRLQQRLTPLVEQYQQSRYGKYLEHFTP